MTKPDATGEPVTLQTIRTSDLSSTLTAHIDENGSLVLSGHDLGPRVAAFVGDDEYEYWLVVRAEHLAAVATAVIEELREDGDTSPRRSVTHLLRQAYRRKLFGGVSDLSQWLAEREVLDGQVAQPAGTRQDVAPRIDRRFQLADLAGVEPALGNGLIGGHAVKHPVADGIQPDPDPTGKSEF